MSELPSLFAERLQKIIPPEYGDSVRHSFSSPKPRCFRINRLKVKAAAACRQLSEKGIVFTNISWYEDAIILAQRELMPQRILELVQEGGLYQQSLSSMLVPLILDPQPHDKVLDMCAAPGSKTTQMAALMHNEGEITALESSRARFYKLKSVTAILGVQNVRAQRIDARRFRSADLFDRILLDAPCSTEGRFNLSDKKSFGFWSLRKIHEMVRKQRGLILQAVRLLKPQGVLVYATCTFSPEENEGIIDWVLKKSERRLQVVPVEAGRWPGILTYPAVIQWEEKQYDSQTRNCLRILPNHIMDGFFVAKLMLA